MESRAYIFMLSMMAASQGKGLPGIINELTEGAKQVLEGLIFLSFIIGLALYVIPWLEELAAKGKAIMIRAVIAQIIYAMATTLFTWLQELGSTV